MTPIETAIIKLDARLKDLPFKSAFIGGSVLSLLVTDPAADAIRITKDVDVLIRGGIITSSIRYLSRLASNMTSARMLQSVGGSTRM